MIRIGQISRPTRLLIAANVVLSIVIALQLTYPARPNLAQSAGPPESVSALPEFGDISLNPPRVVDLADMLGRPLFFVDRRLPEPRVEAAPPPPPTPLRLKLEGVAISGGDRIAVLRDLNNNQLVQLAEGGAHDGWQLESVTSNSASFNRGAQQTELLLDPEANSRR